MIMKIVIVMFLISSYKFLVDGVIGASGLPVVLLVEVDPKPGSGFVTTLPQTRMGRTALAKRYLELIATSRLAPVRFIRK